LPSPEQILVLIVQILNRAATDWTMLYAAAKVPMYRLQKVEPRWEPRERIHARIS
jgi:hypothetical protein